MSLQQTYTQNQLKTIINYQTFQDQIIYYSIAGKLNNTGIFNNDRMVFLNQKTSQFYYTDIAKAPFKDRSKVPIPKKTKDVVNLLFGSLFHHDMNSTDLKVQYMKKDQSNKDVTSTWQFTFANKPLAKQWFQKIQQIKNRALHSAIGVGDDPINSNQRVSFIHQTINFALLPQQRQKQQTHYPNNQNRYMVNQQNKQRSRRESQLQRSRLQKQMQRNRLNQNQNSMSNEKYGANSRLSNNNQNLVNQSFLSRNNNIQNSRMNNSNLRKQDSNIRNSNIGRSNLSEGNNSRYQSKSSGDDWNYLFFKSAHEQIILEYEKNALQSFYSIYQDEKRNVSDQLRIYKTRGVHIYVTDNFSDMSKKLKQQFRNYHYIVQATKDKFVIGVPLCCLIEFEGLLALIKAPIPERALQIEGNQQNLYLIRDLERYTKIKNDIFIKHNNCKMYDLSSLYGEDSNKKQSQRVPLIFIDQLQQYLPYISQNQTGGGITVRPQFILDNINYIVPGGTLQENNMKGHYQASSQIIKKTISSIQSISQFLSNQQFLFANILELKNFLHINGLNLKNLPLVYKQVSNKLVKKYIHTCMVAKTVKDDIIYSLFQLNKEPKKKKSLAAIVEQLIKVLIQGNTNVSTERWKAIAMQFKKKFNISLNSHQIIPGFFLNSLMCLIKANYDVKKINQEKTLFKDEDIIAQGFVKQLIPKTKSYWRFTTAKSEALNNLLRQTSSNPSRENFQDLVQTFNLKQKGIPQYFSLNQNDKRVVQYISAFVRPQGMDLSSSSEAEGYRNLKSSIYANVNKQPPTEFSIMISKMYLQYAIQSNKTNEFKKVMEQIMKILDYWLDEYHPYHCDFYDCLADYYISIGNLDQSINYAKQSLIICFKSGTRTAKLLGQKCYSLADKQLKAGYKAQALQNFNKAKINMQQQQKKSDYYPLVLMNLGLLYLNSGNIDKCIEYSVLAEKQFQLDKNKQWQRQSIKTYEIMSRAFQISQMKSQMREMSLRVAQKFNRTKSGVIFEQMIRICMTGAVGKLTLQKSQILIKCLQKVITGNQQQMKDSNRSIDYLMKKAQSYTVMQRFIHKCDSIERVWNEINSKRALSSESIQFLNLLGYISGAIGDQFIIGLVQQKEYD